MNLYQYIIISMLLSMYILVLGFGAYTTFTQSPDNVYGIAFFCAIVFSLSALVAAIVIVIYIAIITYWMAFLSHKMSFKQFMTGK